MDSDDNNKLYPAIASEAQEAIRKSCAGWTCQRLAASLIEAGAWPESYLQKFQTAEDRVRACRSTSKSQTFSPGDLLVIQQATGVHAWHEFEARLLGRRSERLTAEDQIGALEDDIRAMGAQMQAVAEQLAGTLRDLALLREREGAGGAPDWRPGRDGEAPIRFFRAPDEVPLSGVVYGVDYAGSDDDAG